MTDKTLENETAIIDCLISTVLNAGYCISVYDGEAVIVNRSTNPDDIKESLRSTDLDWLRVLKVDEPYIVGSVCLVYNNGDDGLSVISDTASQDHAYFDQLLEPVEMLVDSLSSTEL